MSTSLQRTSLGELGGFSTLASTSLGELGGAAVLIVGKGGLDDSMLPRALRAQANEEAEFMYVILMAVSTIKADQDE